MKRKKIISATSIIIGFFLDGFAFTTTLGNPISTICLLLGLALMLFGFVLFMISFSEK